MNLNGVGSGAAGLLRTLDEKRANQSRDGGAASGPLNTPARTAASGLLAPRREALPPEAPEGTDPELWNVLTSEERAFFARMSAAGPLTYGRVVSTTVRPDSSLVLGRRLDVRV